MPRRSHSTLDHRALDSLLRRQSGVVARDQVLDLGGDRNDVRRRLAGNDWAGVHDGVYVNHTGTPTRLQHQWAAVLRFWPAALHADTALEVLGLTQDRGTRSPTIHVMVDATRRVVAADGIRVERVRNMSRWTSAERRPPRAILEFAALKAASRRDETSAIGLLSDVVNQGLSTAGRLAGTLDELPRLPQRGVLLEVLRDVANGTRSVLERRYLRDVERAHGLPVGQRQSTGLRYEGVVHRDVVHAPFRTRIELDGAFGHRDSVDRWNDLGRDVDSVVDGFVTLRPGWAQVAQPCRLAAAVGLVLARRGWTGRPRRCGDGCSVEVWAAPIGPILHRPRWVALVCARVVR